MGRRILLLGVYGMETVECGGALAINAKNGGQSFASIMLAADQTQIDVNRAAEILGIEKVYYNNFDRGMVDLRYEYKTELIRVIRETKPDIIITQDPEHILSDLDPDRRPAMTLILESIALSSRDFALDDMPGLLPHPIPKIYYMSPKNANCVINIADVWDLKEKAMDGLESQMEFSGQHFTSNLTEKERNTVVPGFDELDSDYKRGRLMHKAIDKSLYMYYGICGHGHTALAEPYRFEGNFEFDELY
jgi:LmbE family N-acetylglucosaminyl deacetylase